MRNSFNYYKQVESPNMYLCNPNQKIIGAVIAESRNVALRFNDLSELTFTVRKGLCADEIYEKIETRRLIFVEQIGWFQITSVTNDVDGESESKEVACESHQTQLKSRGFISEERVYMFYNPRDKFDDEYESSNTAGIPSVVGQLYQQLGIKIKEPLDKEAEEIQEDCGDWTIVYIDESLYFKAEDGDQYVSASKDNICRSFSSATTFGYDFIINDVEEAFEVVFEFDFLHHAIKVKRLEDITKQTNIYLSLDNLVETMSVSENADDIVTVLSCSGNDIDICTVNPMGTNYIVNFDYYKKVEDADGVKTYPWMSKELIEALEDWNKKCSEDKKKYEGYVSDLQKLYQTNAEEQAKLKYANLKLIDLENAQGQYTAGDIKGDELIIPERVDSGTTSLLETSGYYNTVFNENSKITAYENAPKAILNEDGEYKFLFSGNGKTDTANSMLVYFIDSDEKNSDGEYEASESSETYLYFSDDTTGKSYCKLRVSAEVGLVKDDDGNLAEDGTVTIKGKSFKIGTKDTGEFFSYTVGNNAYEVNKSSPYFTYDSLRFKIIKSADSIVSVYCFYVAGFTRYSTYKTTLTGDNNWLDIWDNYAALIEERKEENDSAIKKKENDIAEITGECKVLNFIRKKGVELYNELQNYWIEGEYTNDSISASDDTTMSERIDLANELLEAGQKELDKVSQPTFELSVSAINFLKLIDFRTFSDELELGRIITIERDDNTHYRPALTSIEYDLDDSDTFALTFSTAAKLNEPAMTLADLLNETSSTSRTVSSNWSNLTDYSKSRQTIDDLLKNPLDRTLRVAQGNMSNQEFTIDTTGILGKKWSDDSHTAFENQQVRIANNTIIFTNDGWSTIKTALGKISYTHYSENESGEIVTSGAEAYGLATEVLVGNLMLTSQMQIVNENGSIRLDENGIVIKSGKSNVFKADTDGDLYLKGTVTATSGSFGQLKIEEDGSINSLSGNFSVDAKGNLVAKGDGEIGGYKIGQKDLTSGNVGMSSNTESGAYAFWAGLNESGENVFSVSNKGEMIASYGAIGAINFAPVHDDTTALFTDRFFLGTTKNDDGTTESFLSFGEVTKNEDGDYIFSTSSIISEYAVKSSSGTFESANIDDAFIRFLESRTINAWTLSTNSISSNAGNDTGFVFNTGESIHGYYAKLTESESQHRIIMTIYDSSDNSVVKLAPCTRTFTICYKCIASTEKHEVTVPIVKGQPVSVSIETKAFFGLSYMYFDSHNGFSTKSFLVEDETPDTNIGCRGNLVPYGTKRTIGTSTAVWDAVYVKDGAVSSSDENVKHDIRPISNEYDLVYDQLVPSTFVFNENSSGRTHIGLIAQNLKKAIESVGLTTKDCAAYVEWKNEDGSIGCGIRYSELISLNMYEIQKLKKLVKQLQAEIKELKGE